jgi:glucose/arabinose dehydrogenase
VVSRFEVATDGLSADPSSELVILTQDQPHANHNGGLIMFGPDDMLYVGFGDGGSQGDPDGNAQDLATWLGKILRIDVNPAGWGEAAGYVAPVDNPFVGDPEAAPEIWMYGLRNPWRFTFDAEGAAIAVADVGGSEVEEVTILSLEDAAGANLGWDLFEGSSCYEAPACDPADLVMPSVEYSHDNGCSITGGVFVAGGYLYGDYCSGLIWLATPQDDGGWSAGAPGETGLRISSFGTGSDGTVYLCDLAGGSVYRVEIAA